MKINMLKSGSSILTREGGIFARLHHLLRHTMRDNSSSDCRPQLKVMARASVGPGAVLTLVECDGSRVLIVNAPKGSVSMLSISARAAELAQIRTA